MVKLLSPFISIAIKRKMKSFRPKILWPKTSNMFMYFASNYNLVTFEKRKKIPCVGVRELGEKGEWQRGHRYYTQLC